MPVNQTPGTPWWKLSAQHNESHLTGETVPETPGLESPTQQNGGEQTAPGTSSSATSAQNNVGASTSQTAPDGFGPGLGAPPEGELAHTGADGVGVLAGIAASLVAAGSGLVIAGRHRKDDEELSNNVD